MTPRVLAADAEHGVKYKTLRSVAGIRAYYLRARPGIAKRLVSRLTPRLTDGIPLRTDELEELRAARASLDGRAVLFLRYILWADRVTGNRGRVKSYVALPPDYVLRPKRRAAAPVPQALTTKEAT